LGIFFLAGSRK